MTRRKTPTKQAPQASTEAVESVKQKSNTKVAQANTTAKKASTGGRKGRPKKAVPVEQKKELIVAELVQDSVGKVVAQEARPYASAGNAIPSKYEQLKAWLVFKLYHYTSYFRGY